MPNAHESGGHTMRGTTRAAEMSGTAACNHSREEGVEIIRVREGLQTRHSSPDTAIQPSLIPGRANIFENR
jgi:carbamoylphosphate synthase large subunit